MAPLDVSRIKLGEMTNTYSGTKTIPISLDSKPLYWIPENPLKIIWQPKGFNDPEANRVTICFDPTEEAAQFVKGLDEAIIDFLYQNDQSYFGENMSKEQNKI